MALLTPGFWTAKYWPDPYWDDNYWPDFGLVEDWTPADLVAELVITNLGLMTDPALGGSWPLFVGHEPDSPNNCGTVYDVTGDLEVGLMSGGLAVMHHGVEIKLRGVDTEATWIRLNTIMSNLNTIQNEIVVFGGLNYVINALTRVSTIQSLGKESFNTKRLNLYTIFYQVTITTP